MGRCEYCNVKLKCEKETCCFDCKDKCMYENDMCPSRDSYNTLKLKGYPQKCRYYIKEK